MASVYVSCICEMVLARRSDPAERKQTKTQHNNQFRDQWYSRFALPLITPFVTACDDSVTELSSLF